MIIGTQNRFTRNKTYLININFFFGRVSDWEPWKYGRQKIWKHQGIWKYCYLGTEPEVICWWCGIEVCLGQWFFSFFSVLGPHCGAQALHCSAQTSLVVVCRLSCPLACAILVPQPGIKPTSPALEGGFLTTRSPRKSPWSVTLLKTCISRRPLNRSGYDTKLERLVNILVDWKGIPK